MSKNDANKCGVVVSHTKEPGLNLSEANPKDKCDQSPAPKPQTEPIADFVAEKQPSFQVAVMRRLIESRLSLDNLRTLKLSRDVSKYRVRSYDYHVKFLPSSFLKDTITSSLIRKELRRCDWSTKPSKTSENTTETHNFESYRYIMAILYLMKQPKRIGNFVQCGVSDSDLPLKITIRSKGTRVLYSLTSLENTESTPVDFEKQEDAEMFEEKQWTALIPVLSRTDRWYIPSSACSAPDKIRIPHYKFPSQAVLPFEIWDPVPQKSGFGQVAKVKIHPDHHFFENYKVWIPFMHLK